MTRALLLISIPHLAWAQARPEVLLIVDTSSSMSATVDAGLNACGLPAVRINEAACAVRNLHTVPGNPIFGLSTFGFTCSATGPSHYSPGPGGGCGSTGCVAAPANDPAPGSTGFPYASFGCADSAEIGVPMRSAGLYELRSWGDGEWSSCTTPPIDPALGGHELSTGPAGILGAGCAVPGAGAPLAGALREATDYLRNLNAPAAPSPYVSFEQTGAIDPSGACRPVHVVLLVDGTETCLTNGPRGARLNARNLGCMRVDLNLDGDTNDNPIPSTGRYEANVDLNADGDCYDTGEQRAFRVKTHVIGLGVTCPNTDLEAIALAGGVALHTVPGCGSQRAWYANDSAAILGALGSIVASTNEVCNGIDDDCSGVADDGLGTTTCGTGVCQRTTMNCIAGATQTCTPGTGAGEICNGLDDDCDGAPDDDAGCPVDAGITDAGITDAGFSDAGFTDAGFTDAGFSDAGFTDAGFTDAGFTDAGFTDAGFTDAGFTDAGFTDAGFTDAGFTDAGFTDAGFTDAGFDDAGPADAGFMDAAVSDSGAPDASVSDAGVVPPMQTTGCACQSSGPATLGWLIALAALAMHRRARTRRLGHARACR